ncbi:MAG: sulfite exporter TauE/SafE family protein, partial [Armatimonadota bacterium]|nr:sulfite exporter TauE/SafE family protein [Armatimonadota bacterium]
PLLMHLFGVPPPIAVGSALCQKCGTSIASFLKYRHLGRGEPRIDLVMIGGSLIGVDAGTRLLSYLSRAAPLHLTNGRTEPLVDLALDILFLVSLSAVSVFTFREAWKSRHESDTRGDATVPGFLVTGVRIPPYIHLPGVGLREVSVPLLAYLGFFLGVASGLMGIGGGVLFMPILLYGFGLSARNAAGTGVLLLFATVSVGTIEQALQGFVSLKLAMCILVGSSIGSQLGAITTHHLPNRTLRLLFAVLVAATALMILWDLVRMVSAQ